MTERTGATEAQEDKAPALKNLDKRLGIRAVTSTQQFKIAFGILLN
jgi:hypothetical protein